MPVDPCLSPTAVVPLPAEGRPRSSAPVAQRTVTRGTMSVGLKQGSTGIHENIAVKATMLVAITMNDFRSFPPAAAASP